MTRCSMSQVLPRSNGPRTKSEPSHPVGSVVCACRHPTATECVRLLTLRFPARLLHGVEELSCENPSVPATEEMLEAHVAFELSRWTGEGLAESLTEEVTALFGWFAHVNVRDVLDQKSATEIVDWVIERAEISDELAAIIGEAIVAGHKAALADGTLVGDVVSPTTYDAAAAAIIDLRDLREELTAQVTTSEVYSRLMSHVLYQGIKNYMQTENVIAKKVPGASALMKVGQNALNSAAPKLEKAIDKQLTSFVNANIQDSIRDSKQFLDKVVDAELLTSVADEVWDTNAKTPVSEFAALVPAKSIAGLIEVGRTGWEEIKQTETFANVISAVIADFYKRNGKKKVGTVLEGVGVTEATSIEFVQYLAPTWDAAVAEGFVEERLRNRLSAFYDQYEA